MIKSINSSSIWLDISGSRQYLQTSSVNFKYPDTPYVGQIVYDLAMQESYVYNGNQWCRLESHATIGVTPITQDILHWASKRMHDEQNLDALCDKYPALAEAREQFQAMKALVSDHDN